MSDAFDQARLEADRAHAKHGPTSLRSERPSDPDGHRFRVLLEEVGEVAREFNEGHSAGVSVNLAALRAELIQVCAMAGDWAESLAAVPATGPLLGVILPAVDGSENCPGALSIRGEHFCCEGGRHGGWPHANGVAGAVWYGDAGDSARLAVERRSRE
jgi:hypothetical protein